MDLPDGLQDLLIFAVLPRVVLVMVGVGMKAIFDEAESRKVGEGDGADPGDFL